MKINIIGDIAGRFDELMLLLEKMPEADLILSVGDMVDRGHKSPQVLKWFMETENVEALYGNHEDLMVKGIESGETDYGNWCMWTQNGGLATLESFGYDGSDVPHVDHRIIDWLKKRPMYFQTDDLFVSHAPVTMSLEYIPQDPYDRDHYFIWNRFEPSHPQEKFMIHGHNGRFRNYKWGDGTEYAICLDNSHKGVLTGIHWPTREIFEQEFLPENPIEDIEGRSESLQRELQEDEKKILEILRRYSDY
jgi:serine/threonine protein phosphatase 1